LKASLLVFGLALLAGCHEPVEISGDSKEVQSVFKVDPIRSSTVHVTFSATTNLVVPMDEPERRNHEVEGKPFRGLWKPSSTNYVIQSVTFASDITYTIRILEVNPGTNYTMGRGH
jgi:hypothetical protein